MAMKRASTLAVVLVLVVAGCSYPDLRRPVVRNYAADLFYRSQRPPQEVKTQVRGVDELALALSRWNEMTGSATEPYTVGPGDVLKISIFLYGQLDADLAAEQSVGYRGEIRCPLLGEVQVAGLSTAQIEGTLTTRYSTEGYYQNPVLSVVVSEYRSKRVFVTGGVVNPGPLALDVNRMALLEVLLRAGGLTEGAGDTAIVTRLTHTPSRTGSVSTPSTISVNLSSLIERSDMVENIWIQPGDVVHVPPADESNVYVLGFVNAPGAYPLPAKGSIGVLDAIALAHGLSAAGVPAKTYLLRKTAEGERNYRIDLTRVAAAKEPDIPVQAGDRVIVSTSFLRRTVDGILVGTGLRSLAPAY